MKDTNFFQPLYVERTIKPPLSEAERNIDVGHQSEIGVILKERRTDDVTHFAGIVSLLFGIIGIFVLSLPFGLIGFTLGMYSKTKGNDLAITGILAGLIDISLGAINTAIVMHV